jgi:Kef-type K+ transport system membrane component KefB
MAPFAQVTHAVEQVPAELLWIPIALLAARLFGVVERWGQPAVLGELLAGILLGNLALIGFPFLEPMADDAILDFLAQLGVVILLFQIGLESSVAQMRRVGVRALLVAVVGVATPLLLGVLAGPYLLPGSSLQTNLFLGAALTATSVGITARVFRDLGTLQTAEAAIVLGAAVIDDVLGLVLLAMAAAIVSAGTVTLANVAGIVATAVGFLAAALVTGTLLAPWLGRLLSAVHPGAGMKLTLALSVALLTAYAAGMVGLAPIVGAFAAGLVLVPVHFRDFDEPRLVRDVRAVLPDVEPVTRARLERTIGPYVERHVEHLLDPVAQLFVPIFFVVTGMKIDLSLFLDASLIAVACGYTLLAIIGKVVSGAVAGPVRRSVVGWGMVPRGEVGLIFANVGHSIGAVSDRTFSVIVLIVVMTTLLTPPILARLLRRTGSS